MLSENCPLFNYGNFIGSFAICVALDSLSLCNYSAIASYQSRNTLQHYRLHYPKLYSILQCITILQYLSIYKCTVHNHTPLHTYRSTVYDEIKLKSHQTRLLLPLVLPNKVVLVKPLFSISFVILLKTSTLQKKTSKSNKILNLFINFSIHWNCTQGFPLAFRQQECFGIA